TPTNILLLSLAFSDFLVGTVLMPIQTLQITYCWFLNPFLCSLYMYVIDIILFSSVINMVLISVDRYVAICDPLHYTSRITVNRVKFCVCLLWSCSVAYNSYFFLLHLIQQYFSFVCFGNCASLSNNIATSLQLVLNFIIPVTVIIVLYMRLFFVAMSQARAMRSHITAVTKQISVTKTAKKSELKAARTLGVLVVVFLMCFTPAYFVSVGTVNFIIHHSLAYFVQYLYYFNSCLNPVIYALFYPWFRKTAKLIVTLQILQPGSCEANIL
ncbi:trace amine-associated receptor 13c-like, partial [Centropristis striata]|uniref:trace amine-associated receptor 13c-like n=1 Tax=Centropristis striata TaxID=184440 RepID=UPI0027DFFACC